MPYEEFVHEVADGLYDRDDDARFDRVTVCWLDEEACDPAPLAAIQRAVRQLADPASRKVDVHVIGPSSTDTLLAMAEEYEAYQAWNSRRRSILPAPR